MISFVWTPGEPLLATSGAAATSTIGHVRELNRRGVESQVVTIGRGVADGRSSFSGVPFLALRDVAEVSRLPGLVVFQSEFPAIRTLNKAFHLLQGSPPQEERERRRLAASTRERILIATDPQVAALWAEFLEVDVSGVHIVAESTEELRTVLMAAATPAERGARPAGTIRTEEHR